MAQPAPSPASPRTRRVPTQRRSRERYERILDAAAEVMAEKGSDAFRMSDVVERTGVSFGSLYQYFPDKTALIGTLAERYNAVGHACVRNALAPVDTPAELHRALGRIIDEYYGMFLEVPVMRDIWSATQADRALQDIDETDIAILAGLLCDRLADLAPERDPADLARVSRLAMHLIAAAVRYAITLDRPEAERVLATFKRMLPRDLADLA